MQVSSAPVALRFRCGGVLGGALEESVPINQSSSLTGDQQEATDSPRYVARHGHKGKGQTEEARLAWGRCSCHRHSHECCGRARVQMGEDLSGFSALSAERRRPVGAVQTLGNLVMTERLVFVEVPETRAVAGEARDGGEDVASRTTTIYKNVEKHSRIKFSKREHVIHGE